MESISNEEKAAGAARRKARVKKPEGEAAEGGAKQGKKHYEIDIFRGWCKSCGICSAFCPRECIKPDAEGNPVADSSRCTGCGWCELHCPDFAIGIREKDADDA